MEHITGLIVAEAAEAAEIAALAFHAQLKKACVACQGNLEVRAVFFSTCTTPGQWDKYVCRR